MKKVAMITGVTGQDGSYLSELLLQKDYKVIGLKRRTSSIDTRRIDHLFDNSNFILDYFDLTDSSCIYNLLKKYKPCEIYNLGAQSHVRVSFDIPEYTVDTIVSGTLKLLEAIRNVDPGIKFYQASSSEMYGDSKDYDVKGYTELSRMQPASPYACAKLFAHTITNNYRKSYGIHASCGILFNHESPRRGETFVTKKISRRIAEIKLGIKDSIELGNLDSCRDWGFAGDYVEAMQMMVEHVFPDDYVVATGKTKSVKEYLVATCNAAGINPESINLKINEKLFRPSEVPFLLGNAQKIESNLGWKPKTNFDQLVEMMYKNEYDSLKK